ncbi:MAG: hypothetical protein P9F75_15435 [Candidatus Contendobacter sp.]|nr:hypothetical protein [Candidatus Contendobacter sp.]
MKLHALGDPHIEFEAFHPPAVAAYVCAARGFSCRTESVSVRKRGGSIAGIQTAKSVLASINPRPQSWLS